MKTFLCHSSKDSKFVIEVAKHLKRNLDKVFYYEEYQRSDQSFIETINQELEECEVMVIFVGSDFSEKKYPAKEANTADTLSNDERQKSFFIILLSGQTRVPAAINMLRTYPTISVKGDDLIKEAYRIAKKIVTGLGRPWLSADGLPHNPHLFSYEKDIIDYFIRKNSLGEKAFLEDNNLMDKWLDGCPADWPKVVHWKKKQTKNKFIKKKESCPRHEDAEESYPRPDDAMVLAAALKSYHWTGNDENTFSRNCPISQGICFPEAGPREMLSYPQEGEVLKVGVIVSGGIAPGINAVIDGITQRHYRYAKKHQYDLKVHGLKNGFYAFDDLAGATETLAELGQQVKIEPVTSEATAQGGSKLRTSRVDELLNPVKRLNKLQKMVNMLVHNNYTILYVIGGDGSMKAAHALWSVAQNMGKKLSIVTIPKTMDNDILWVWQTFGFLSAVEKAREVIEHLSAEVKSNPRLCVVQLFGSDSGFVVSHAVLASRTGICYAALIPEVEFSMTGLATYIKKRIHERRDIGIPSGLIVMAETAIPTDAMDFINDKDIGLSEDEKDAIKEFDKLRDKGKRIQGQTNDYLRSAGLKIVKNGLHKLLPESKIKAPGPFPASFWSKMRVFSNEPRHLLRAIPPSCSDIINGQRLGMLAVDNALAGYTDFMISQWLTEYILVPLDLVVLGRKRIPTSGIFWKSILTKTGQPSDLVNP
jgi:6-phosphofructokinase 1